MGFVVRQKAKNGRINLYFALSFWDKNVQGSRQSRKYLGQLSDDGLEIIKSRSLPGFSADEKNVLLKREIEFKGRECLPPGLNSNRPRRSSSATLREWRSVEYGRIAALRLLSEQCGLTAALEVGFEVDARNILASAIFECVDGKAYDEKVRNYGAFIILNSDPAPDGLSTLIENRRRDNVEKFFDTLKNATGNDRLHSTSDAVAEGKILIGFVATILHSMMENRLREKGMLVKMTVNQAFDLLRKIRVAIGKDGKRVMQEIPKKTRDLLDNIDLALPNP